MPTTHKGDYKINQNFFLKEPIARANLGDNLNMIPNQNKTMIANDIDLVTVCHKHDTVKFAGLFDNGNSPVSTYEYGVHSKWNGKRLGGIVVEGICGICADEEAVRVMKEEFPAHSVLQISNEIEIRNRLESIHA